MKNFKAIQIQGGSALIICLVLLMVLSLIGISSVENSLLEEKMAVNTQVKSMVFQATKSEAQAQFSFLEENKNILGITNIGDVALNDILPGLDVNSALSYIGDFERRPRRKEDIQSLGARVIVNELTVSSAAHQTGTVSVQTVGLEQPAPSS